MKRLVATCVLLMAAEVYATTMDDVGFTQLATELGANLPDGAGIQVTQVEADADSGSGIKYLPDVSDSELAGKNIVDLSNAGNGPSSHATGVAKIFYGDVQSLAPGISDIDAYLADDWLQSGFLSPPAFFRNPAPQPASTVGRLANHSWNGATASPAINQDWLSRVDWLVSEDDYLQVAGFTGSTSASLLSSAFNAIAVNKTDAQPTAGSASAGGIYNSGRTRPHLVAPGASPSNATPVVAAAAALLIDKAHGTPGLSTDPDEQWTVNRSSQTIRNAERSEVIKALLMAGADRQTANSSAPDIVNYRVSPADRTSNGLDRRHGAGQLNIHSSYQMLISGEQNGIEDQPSSGGQILARGFDYEPAFGGSSGSNSTGTYFFNSGANPAQLSATLVWNLAVDGGSSGDFDGSGQLFDLNLFLYDVSDSANWVLIGSSVSTINNTETIWQALPLATDLALRVEPAAGQGNFKWDYGLAWQRSSSFVDSDGDGIADSLEGRDRIPPLDSDADGSPDYLDTDSDGNGIDDWVEVIDPTTPRDTDSDGSYDFQDSDNDNDGVPDLVEIGGDTNNPLDLNSDTIFDYMDSAALAGGDLSLDGRVDVSDLVVMQQSLLGVTQLEVQQEIHADLSPVGGDGKIDISDLQSLQAILVGD